MRRRLTAAALAVTLGGAVLAHAGPRPQEVVFATLVARGAEERSAATLIESIRAFAGPYREAPVYVVVTDLERFPCTRAKALGATLLSLDIPEAARSYPFAAKAYAAAQVEGLVAATAGTMVWTDAETLFLAPPAHLVLGDGAAVALKPVFKLNTIGQAPDTAPDAFWGPLYEAVGVDPAAVPDVQVFETGETVRAYYNCGVIAFDPARGICREWSGLLTRFLEDAAYQKNACPDVLHRIFLHQAVLSALIVARTSDAERLALPAACGYPYHLQEELPEDRRIASLNDAEVLIYEDAWERRTDFLDVAPATGDLRSWLADAWLRRLAVTDRIYRDEHESNSYLVLAGGSSVLIDPTGASYPASPFHGLVSEHPLEAILLTHAHRDHRVGIASWKADRDLPVIAHRAHADFLRYEDRLAAFLGRRAAAQQGRVASAEELAPRTTPVEVTVTFDERYGLKVGDLDVEMIHTGGETPDTSLVWIPQLEAAFIADSFYTSFPNVYTLRGTRPRWALDYIGALDAALQREPVSLFPGHGEPVIGKERVRRELTRYRDALAWVHDATVAGMNAGKDVYTLMGEIVLPEELALPQYFGRVDWTVRGIVDGYAGWFDGDPASMYAQPPASIYPDLVDMAGGADAVATRAATLTAEGAHVKALHLANVVLAGAPDHRGALQARLAALRALRRASRNYIERNWLAAGIREAEAKLAQ